VHALAGGRSNLVITVIKMCWASGAIEKTVQDRQIS